MNLPGSFKVLQSCFMCVETDINKNKSDRLWSVFLRYILVCTGFTRVGLYLTASAGDVYSETDSSKY